MTHLALGSAVLLLSCTLAAADATFVGADPLAWAAPPRAPLSTAVVMSAQALGDAAEYNFVCTAGGAAESGWQASPDYRCAGLKPSTDYTFVAHVRDKTSRVALRAPSAPVSAHTPPANRFDGIVAGEAELIPIQISGDKDNRINIVIINRWRKDETNPYNKPAMRETFLKDVHDCIDPAFALDGDKTQRPFANYKPFYNVYALWWPSTPPWDPPAYDKGQSACHWAVYNELVRDRLFLPWRRDGRGWVTHLAWVNSRGGGGGAGLLLDQRVGDALIEGNNIPPFFHEFSHTAMKLGDKYIGWGMWGRADESSNTTLFWQRDRVPWKAWIAPTTPVPTPYNRENLRKTGLFEGGVHRPSGIFRTTPVCSMGVNQFGDTLCALCTQQAVLSHYDYVDPIDSAVPSRADLVLATPGKARFGVARVHPVPDTQQTEWRLNGKVIAQGRDEIDVDLGALAEYELVYSLIDRSPYVREDPPFSRYPRAERRWRITNPKPTSAAAPLTVAVQTRNLSVLGVNDGRLTAQVRGGVPPYTYTWSCGGDKATATGLDAGRGTLVVVDSECRSASAAWTLERPTTMTVDARSTCTDGRWQVDLRIGGADLKQVACRWSSGASGPSVRGLRDGEYSYVVRHASGAEKRGELKLARPTEPLAAEIDHLAASTGENNGEIHLRVAGGRAPYSYTWTDAPAGAERMFLPPGAYHVVVRDANQSAVELSATVRDEPAFTLARPRFEAAGQAVRIGDAQPGWRYLWYDRDYPGYIARAPRGIYEGVFTTADGQVVEATGAVIANVDGFWANGSDVDKERNREHNDHGSWVRLDAYVKGRTEKPVTFKIDCDHDGTPGARLALRGSTKRGLSSHDLLGEAVWQGTCDRGRLIADGVGPDGGHFDLRYTARHEDASRPIHVGASFVPPRPGQYWVAAQREESGAVSFNRVGVSIAADPLPTTTPLAPDKVTGSKLLCWLDAADFDGDGKEDSPQWPRSSLLGWRAKPSGGFTPGAFVIAEPNSLNGRETASWQWIWVEDMQAGIAGYQTVFMVYRDHDLSKLGTGPWEGVDAYLGDLRGKPELAQVDKPFRDGRAWLDGQLVDPYATPAPLDWRQVTFELATPSSRAIRRTHTLWEGSVAEFIAFDTKLSDADRLGVEEYLRRKWLAEVRVTR